MRDDEVRGVHRPVTWIELFFDLFVVVVLARIAHELGEAHFTPSALLVFLGQFVPLFWIWVGATYYIERFETAGLEFRLTFLGFMAVVAGLGAFSHHAMVEHFAGYAGTYAAGRLFTALLWLHASLHQTRQAARGARVLAAGTLTGVLLIVISCFLDGVPRYAVFAAGLLADIFAPRLTARAQTAFPPVSTSKYPERFGLFTIIALGECAAGLIGGLGDARHPAWGAGLLCLFLTFGMWWVYFDFVGRRKFRQSARDILAWVYSHIGLFAAIAIAGAAMREALHHADGAANVVGMAVGAFLILVAMIEAQLSREPGEPAHAVASPALKVATGAALIIGAVFFGGLFILCLSAAALSFSMIYGLWVWHTTEIAESSTIH